MVSRKLKTCLPFSKIYFFNMYMCMSVYMHLPLSVVTLRVQKRILGPMKLESQVFVSI